MNHQETIALLAALKSAGVSHFKSGDTDITLSSTASTHEQFIPRPIVQAEAQTPVQPIENESATAKIKDLIETLKMDDASLLDKIFPAGAGG